MGKPVMIDQALLLQAGIDPKTLKPIRLGLGGQAVKESFRKIFRIVDEQDAVNRYKWYNMPLDLTSEEIERLLYYKGQLCFFKLELNGITKFYLTPFALDGTIDFYGRFNRVHPVPFASGTDMTEKDKKKLDTTAAVLSTLKLNVIKTPKDLEDVTLDDFDNGCVLLHDYCKQWSQTIIPRQQINEAIVDLESDIMPFLRLALLNNTGVRAMKVPDADSKDEAMKGAEEMINAALNGLPFTPVTSKLDFQDLAAGGVGKAEEYLLSLQSLDNIRLSTHGIENGGIFQKKAHVLQKEASMNSSDVDMKLLDGLAYRQHFCNIINSIWGLSAWCEPAEPLTGVDLNRDGVLYDQDLGDKGGAAPSEESNSGGSENE